ncbi:hypothetical protein GE061_016949 [Apolygus lucorum]|uniref:Uncharacterized protein n=1 Tax=Apolygus lucorum TaxID=248454 RepID=A0A8S9XJP1_APOLU|nr:hypothetical protein GE061_016949 [Apolygus lucorum]
MLNLARNVEFVAVRNQNHQKPKSDIWILRCQVPGTDTNKLPSENSRTRVSHVRLSGVPLVDSIGLCGQRTSAYNE